ncbi:hypothetical protein HK101_002141, partial [Irineochytrium annulatum]
ALRSALILTLAVGIPMVAIWFAMVLVCRDVDTTRGVMSVFEDAGKPYAETTKVYGWVVFWILKLVAASVTGRRKLVFSPLIDLTIYFFIFMLIQATIYAYSPNMTFGLYLGCVFFPVAVVEVLWHVFFLDKVDGLKTWWRLVIEYSGVHFGFFGLTLYAQAPIMKIIHKRVYSFLPHWKTPPPKDRNEEMMNNVKMEGGWALVSKLCIYRSYPKSYYLCTCASILLTLAERLAYAWVVRRKARKVAVLAAVTDEKGGKEQEWRTDDEVGIRTDGGRTDDGAGLEEDRTTHVDLMNPAPDSGLDIQDVDNPDTPTTGRSSAAGSNTHSPYHSVAPSPMSAPVARGMTLVSFGSTRATTITGPAASADVARSMTLKSLRAAPTVTTAGNTGERMFQNDIFDVKPGIRAATRMKTVRSLGRTMGESKGASLAYVSGRSAGEGRLESAGRSEYVSGRSVASKHSALSATGMERGSAPDFKQSTENVVEPGAGLKDVLSAV